MSFFATKSSQRYLVPSGIISKRTGGSPNGEYCVSQFNIGKLCEECCDYVRKRIAGKGCVIKRFGAIISEEKNKSVCPCRPLPSWVHSHGRPRHDIEKASDQVYTYDCVFGTIRMRKPAI